jgi:chromosome segregation ATPase
VRQWNVGSPTAFRPSPAVSQNEDVMAPSKKHGKKKTKQPSAPSIARKLSTFARRMKDTERRLSRVRGGLERRERARLETEDVVRQLTGERDTLKDTLDVVSGHRTAAADERVAAAEDLKKAQAEWSALKKRFGKHPAFSIARKTAVTVDTRIEKTRQKIAALETKAAAAEAGVENARARLAEAEKERRDAQETVQRRPLEIKAARGQLAKLVAELSTATPDNVHAFAAAERQFQAAVADLKAHTDARDDRLVRSLLDTAAVDKARSRSEAESLKLSKIRTDLAREQAALQDLLERRDNEIRTRILKQRPAET